MCVVIAFLEPKGVRNTNEATICFKTIVWRIPQRLLHIIIVQDEQTK